MEYKYEGLKYIFNSDDESCISLSLEDASGLIDGIADTYFINIIYSEVFMESYLYCEDSIDAVVNKFCKYVDSCLRKALPDYEDYNNYQSIEGYWECMGIVRQICLNPLKTLWLEDQENQILTCKSIVEKIEKGCLTFSSDELSVIKYSVKEELTSLLAKIKE